MRWFILFFLLSSFNGYASIWSNLWLNKNQQALSLMKVGKFDQAEATFQQPDWRATAAYRAGHYEQAARQYHSLQNEMGFYNAGNALAHQGKLEEAIKAYDQALVLNPKDKDALYNRKLVEDLLKKNQKETQQNQNQQEQQQQNEDKPNQNQQAQQDQDQKDQNQKTESQKNKAQQDQNQKTQQNQQNQNQKKETQLNPDQSKKAQAQQKKDKSDHYDKNQKTQQNSKPEEQSPAEREKQQAKEQWLRLIPDDPAGLLREKFRRDHLRREEGSL